MVESLQEAMERPTKAFAEFVAKTKFTDLSPDVIHEAKRVILDALGCVMGGQPTDIGRIARSLVRELGGRPVATLVGTDIKTSPALAAWANGRVGNALDFDDTFMTVIHMGNPTVAAALAACERMGSSGKDLLTSVAVGYEVGARVAISLGPPALPPQLSGKQPTFAGIAGTRIGAAHFAAAAAAARAFGLNANQTTHAFGIIGAHALRGYTRWSEVVIPPLQKYDDMGQFAQAGIIGALLAKNGDTAHDGILDGQGGLWRITGVAKCDFELMVKDLGKKWHFLDNTYKPWPCCRWTHYGATVFARLVAENKLRAADIDRVLVRSNFWGMTPRFTTKRPVGMIGCEFNHPHIIAMLALGIKRGPDWFTPESLESPEVQAFRNKVDVELEEESLKCEQWYENGQIRKLPAGVEVLSRGKKFSGYTDYAKGDPWSKETYLTDDELREKFIDLATSLQPASPGWQEQMSSAARMIYDLENVESIGDLTGMLTA